MCRKYNLQETADCVSRQREAAMSPPHHTFLIDCDSGVCVCLTDAPRPLSAGTAAYPSSQTLIMAPSSRRLLRTCLTSCMKEQRAETLSDQRHPDPLITDTTFTGPPAKAAHRKGLTSPMTGGRFLQDSLKRWLWRLASCVRAE